MATTTTTSSSTMPTVSSPLPPLNTMQIVDPSTDTDPALVTSAIGRVRFDSACVLIPEPLSPSSRMPRLLKKSYSLPLWRKKPSSGSVASSSATDDQPASPNDDARSRFGFSRHAHKSASRARSSSRDQNEPTQLALVPCIVDHEHPHSKRARRPSLPIPHHRLDVVTVPLRDCCLRCHPVTEESLLEGSEWHEKFTRGARRRRNSSADDIRPAHHKRVSEDIPGFESIMNVDEVDKRRRSREASDSPSPMHGITLNDPEAQIKSDATHSELGLLPSLTRQKLRIATTPLDGGTSRASALIEEDEDQLFPLPSPRRTPNGSPLPSPLATPSSSTTNLAKTLLGQKSSQSTPSASSGSPRLGHMNLQVPSTPPLPREVRGLTDTRGTPGLFTELSGDSSVDSVPELWRSPSPFNSSPSPDLSLSSPSPPISHSRPIAIRNTSSDSPPPPYSESPTIMLHSPQIRQRGDSISGVSISPHTWRKLHLPNAGSILKAGADVLKGVSNMSGGVTV